METLFAFCRKTGRRVSRLINDLTRRLAANGQFRIAISIGIPFIAKLEFGYIVTFGKKIEKPG